MVSKLARAGVRKKCLRCSKAAVLGRSRCKKHLELAREQSRARRDKHTASGRCSECGKPTDKNESGQPYRLCGRHRELWRRYAKAAVAN